MSNTNEYVWAGSAAEWFGKSFGVDLSGGTAEKPAGQLQATVTPEAMQTWLRDQPYWDLEKKLPADGTSVTYTFKGSAWGPELKFDSPGASQ